MTVTFIITVVKTSLALSLGLVGALSIVRFRTPIKEPEELTYLFLSIGIGLGLGANQVQITLLAFFAAVPVIVLVGRFGQRETSENLYITISWTPGQESPKIGLREITDALSNVCRAISIRRFDEAAGVAEATFNVDIESLQHLDRGQRELRKLDPDMRLTFVDSGGVY